MPLAWLNTIHHDGSEKYVSNLTPRLNETVKIYLRLAAAAPVREIYLRTVPDGEQAFIPMTPAQKVPPVQWWVADLFINEPCVNYRFLVVAEDGAWFFSAAGVTNYDPLDATDFRILADYSSPGWLQDTVFYQIFPDNFANGDPSLNPAPETFEYAGHRPQTYPWAEPLPPGAPYSQSYYGGDLPGIGQRLDYLEKLGVNALYLNPIFTAYSCHRYDVVSYDEVDPILGGNEALIVLRQALQTRNMRYILDIVPNHCGMAHPWFLAAQAARTAPEFEFFTFTHYPDEYISWGPYRSLVKLDFRSAELRRRLYRDPGSPFQRWLQPPYSANGWRVDVGNMLGRQGASQLNGEVIREIRTAVKAARPEAYLLGENFHDASAQLQGDQWDGVMNYSGFSSPLLSWLAGFARTALDFRGIITSPRPFLTSALAATWQSRLAAIPWVYCFAAVQPVEQPRYKPRSFNGG